jgi:hypothetical protein
MTVALVITTLITQAVKPDAYPIAWWMVGFFASPIALLFGLPLAYIVALPLALAVNVMFGWLGWCRAWHYGAGGAAIGLATFAVFAYLLQIEALHSLMYDWGAPALVGALAGACSATAFWRIAVRQRGA